MAITSPIIRVNYRYTYLAQKCQNVQYWDISGSLALLIPLVDILEAHWNDMSSALRAIMPAGGGNITWDSLYGEEVGGSLSYAEFAVPTAQRAGTRAGVAAGTTLPSFNAGGFRQTVGTRVTRPGQKRFPFVTEADTVANELIAPYTTLLAAVAEKFSTPSILGAPAALVTMQPVIVGYGVGGVGPMVYQDVTGYVVNPNATSQVSRKIGRGQ